MLVVGVWDFLVFICNCGVGVQVCIDDNGDIYTQGKIHGCEPDWFHKVGRVCFVRRDIDLLEGPERKWPVWGKDLLGIGRCICRQVLLPKRCGRIDTSFYILGILLCFRFFLSC